MACGGRAHRGHVPTSAAQPLVRAGPEDEGRPPFEVEWDRLLSEAETELDEPALAVEGVFPVGHPLAGLVFDELRHTAAALATAQGAHPLANRDRLGTRRSR
jgi:hypothetical protein